MESISVARLADIVGGQLQESARQTTTIQHVTVHSDHVQAESVFFALRGSRTDGHEYVRQAFQNGAVAAVVARREIGRYAGEAGCLVAVDDPMDALHRLARWWRSRLQATFFAVVGSNGKTITKDALVHLASGMYRTYGSPHSYNSQLGVALSVLECPPDCEVAVIEAAATEIGEMARLREIIRPHHVLITNLGTRYRVHFGDIVRQAGELLAMAQGLPGGGRIVIGTPSEQLYAVALSAGVEDCLNGDHPPYFRVTAFQPVSNRLRGWLQPGDGPPRSLVLKTPSEEIFSDIVLAANAALILGIAPEVLISNLGEYSPTSTRMEVWKNSSGATIIRDIATVDGLAFDSALRTARRLTNQVSRIILVLAEPFSEKEVRFAPDLAQIIADRKTDAVFGYNVPMHKALKEHVQRAGLGVRVTLADDADSLRRQLISEIRAEDLVFIQCPRDISLAEVAQNLVEPIASTRLHVDLSAVEANVGAFRRLIGSSTRLMGVIKARAYGTDPIQIAAVLEEVGADFLGVATTSEGITLREAGIRLPILVFIGSDKDVDRMKRYYLTPLVYSGDMLDAVLAEAHVGDGRMDVHVEVDSGMHRTGFDPEDAIEVLRKLRSDQAVRVTGLMTHLGCADMPEEDDFTREQLRRFGEVVQEAERLGFEHIIRHAAATAATIRFPQARLDMVRVGIGLYGIHPTDATRPGLDLTPAISLVSKIIEIYELEPGERVGYGATFKADEGHYRFGVVPAGYFDAVPRAFGRYGSVIVNGSSCRVIGNVSMDSMVIDLTSCLTAKVGSDVLIYGQHYGSAASLEEVAEAMGLIPHELLVNPGPRVQRVFTRH